MRLHLQESGNESNGAGGGLLTTAKKLHKDKGELRVVSLIDEWLCNFDFIE